MIEIDRLKEIINETFQEITIREFALLGKGKSGTICIVNNEIVFKIPLQNEGYISQCQKNEAVVLRFLEGKLDIEIPKILYTATSKSGLYIIGETLLSGTTLSYEMYDTYDDKTKNDILRQLGRIVRKLHEAGVDDLSLQANIPREKFEDIVEEFNKSFSIEIRDIFSSKEIVLIERIYEQYKRIYIQHPVKPVLCHHDLHFGNLMFDIESKQISGILDFGCAGYSEPARDWHYYYYPNHVFKGYGDNGDRFFLVRHKFYTLSHYLNNLSEEVAKEQKPYKSLDIIRNYILNE